MSDNKDWSSLSMRERAAYIRKAVFRGLSDIDDIRKDYHLYGGGGDTLQKEEPIYKVLPALLLLAGLDVRVTSGYRSSGKAGNAGDRSWHPRHGAVDIVPQGNTTFEDIENVIYNNPKVKLYLLSHNFGLLDESKRSKESRALAKITDATGPHFHFGRDTNAVKYYRAKAGALQGGDHGKVVYFTNPDIPLESLEPLVSRESAQMLFRMTPLEVLLNVTIPKPINIDDDTELDIAAEQILPEIEVIGLERTPNPLEILSLIQEVQTAPPVIQSYKIPAILDIVGNLADERNTLLQKDLEDRIIAEDRRRRLGYAYKDSSIEDDIRQMLFLRNMSANGGRLFFTGGNANTEEDDYPEGYWENRREHAPIKPKYKRTKKDEEYWAKKNLQKEEAAKKLNESAGIVMSALLQSAEGTPFTGNEVLEAAELLKQDRLDKLHDYKTGIQAAVTAAELGLSGGSLLGAYANWRNWANAANLTKLTIANILQRALLPMLVGGTMIDAYQTYDALLRQLDFDTYYNAGSTGLGLAGSAGAADLFRNTRVNYPYIDRILDTAGVVLNVGDLLKFGYDTYKNATSLEEKSLSKGNGGKLFDTGGDVTVVPFTQKAEVIITPDTEYNQYLNTLPDNLRFTPNDKYDSYLYWKLNGRPRNFREAVLKGMFTYDHSDNAYHANSIAFDDNTGIGYFMKPKNHDTVGYELDWFNKGLVTEEGGRQRAVTPEEAKELEAFRNKYILIDDPDRPNYYRYQPIVKAEGGTLNIILDTNSYGGGGLTSVINVPSSLKGLWNKAKLRLYRTITPKGYHLLNATKEFISGDDRDFSEFTPAENEVWARYLGVPYEGESSFEKAVYVPTKGGATYDDVIKFKDESLILSDDVLRQLLLNQMTTGKNTLLIEGNESGLGTYTVSLGEDENGKYISYYDDWDINPTRGLSAKYKIPFLELIGDIVPGTHPFTVYGRRYYTDEDLRRVIEK